MAYFNTLQTKTWMAKLFSLLAGVVVSRPIRLWCAFPGCHHGRRHLPDERTLYSSRGYTVLSKPMALGPTKCRWPLPFPGLAQAVFGSWTAHRPLFRRLPQHAHALRSVAADPPFAGALVGCRHHLGDGVEHQQYHHLRPCTFAGDCGLHAGMGAGPHPWRRPPPLANHAGCFAGHADCVCAPEHGLRCLSLSSCSSSGHTAKNAACMLCQPPHWFSSFSYSLLAGHPYPVGRVLPGTD